MENMTINTEKFKIDESLVRKLLCTVDAGLTHGLGQPIPGQMCVEAAISYALGEPHGDGPSCVEPCVRNGKIILNDACWSSNAARTKGMRAVAIAQLGSMGVVNGALYTRRLTEATIREIVPIAMRAAAKVNPGHAQLLESTAGRCEAEGTAAAADCAAKAANCAYADYAATYAAKAAECAADYAAKAATWLADNDAVFAACAYAACAADWAAECVADDKVLSLMASIMVRALRECGSPGCEWLWLVEETAA